MKKSILFTLLFVSVTIVSFGQSKKEQRIIKQANKFVTSLSENLSDVTEEEKTTFFELKKAQIIELKKINKEYERGTDEHKTKFKAVLLNFQKDVKEKFGRKRGTEIIRASLVHKKQ
ncbi:hypothetical protein [Polaribacter sp.]|uniref:hypothetical protein n=1 Tax=Polaribacter sp. TaxID=1920175 RepID=UPI003F6C79C0